MKQYPNLIKTLSFLLKSYKSNDDKPVSKMKKEQNSGIAPMNLTNLLVYVNFATKPNLLLILSDLSLAGMCVGLPWPAFLMSWRRRIGKEDESLFFSGCKDAGLDVKHIGSRVYCIKLGETTATSN